jgi:AraC-like DNA-binding protein
MRRFLPLTPSIDQMRKVDIHQQDQLPRRSSPAEVHFPDHGLTVIESHHAESFHMERKQWAFHKFCWVAMGRGQLELEKGTIPIQRDQFLLLPTGLEHRFVDHHTAPLTLVIACMDERYLVPGGQRESVWQEACASLPPGRPRRARGAFQHSEMIDQLKLMLREQTLSQPGWELATISAAGDLLVHTIRSCIPADDSARNSNDAVDAVIEHLDANFYKQIPLPELAARCNLSSRRFTDLFKLRTGRTLTNYVNERRINYAMERLRETQHILYSCYESGFRDVTYFYRVFKRQSGMTPGDFLASCKTTDHPSVAS